MTNISKVYFFSIIMIFAMSCNGKFKQNKEPHLDNIIVRIASLEIDPAHLEEYLSILEEEAAESVILEDGVLCIFPMYQKENPNEIRLLEIYANEAAYQSHLKTPHFLHYKEATRHMVKSLELVDMEAMDKDHLKDIFLKIK